MATQRQNSTTRANVRRIQTAAPRRRTAFAGLPERTRSELRRLGGRAR